MKTAERTPYWGLLSFPIAQRTRPGCQAEPSDRPVFSSHTDKGLGRAGSHQEAGAGRTQTGARHRHAPPQGLAHLHPVILPLSEAASTVIPGSGVQSQPWAPLHCQGESR